MGQLLFFPRRQEHKPNYFLGAFVFIGIFAFCAVAWYGAAVGVDHVYQYVTQ